MEVKLHLLAARQVVKNHKALALLSLSQLSKINRLSAEGSHASIVGKVGTTQWQVFVEFLFDGCAFLLMVALASESQEITFS
jgi:hypothetical protein